MQSRTKRTRSSDSSATTDRARSPNAWALIEALWAELAAPAVTQGLGVGLILATALSAYCARDAGRTLLEAARKEGGLLARLDELLGLHAPFQAWWFVLLVSLFVVSLVMTLLSVAPGRIGLSGASVNPLREFSLRQLKAAAGRLAPARIVRSEGRLTVLQGRSSLSVGILLASLGALGLSAALGYSANKAALGELALSTGEITKTLSVPGPKGQLNSVRLSASLRLISVSKTGHTAEVQLGEGPTIELTRGIERRMGSTWLELRDSHRVEGSERFRLQLRPSPSAKAPSAPPVEGLLGAREELSLPSGGDSVRVRDFSMDFRNLGPAVWVEQLHNKQVVDAFWVFQGYQGFDGANRKGALAVSLMEIVPGRDIIFGVCQLPGLPLLVGAFLVWVLGLGMLLVSLRGAKRLVICREGVFALPSSGAQEPQDPELRAALDELMNRERP